MEISIEWTVVKFCTEIRGTDLRAQICPAPLPFRQIPLRPGLWRVGLIRCHTFGCSDWLQVYPTAFRGILVCACWITPLWNRKRTDRFQTNMHLQVWFHEICLLDSHVPLRMNHNTIGGPFLNFSSSVISRSNFQFVQYFNSWLNTCKTTASALLCWWANASMLTCYTKMLSMDYI